MNTKRWSIARRPQCSPLFIPASLGHKFTYTNIEQSIRRQIIEELPKQSFQQFDENRANDRHIVFRCYPEQLYMARSCSSHYCRPPISRSWRNRWPCHQKVDGMNCNIAIDLNQIDYILWYSMPTMIHRTMYRSGAESQFALDSWANECKLNLLFYYDILAKLFKGYVVFVPVSRSIITADTAIYCCGQHSMPSSLSHYESVDDACWLCKMLPPMDVLVCVCIAVYILRMPLSASDGRPRAAKPQPTIICLNSFRGKRQWSVPGILQHFLFEMIFEWCSLSVWKSYMSLTDTEIPKLIKYLFVSASVGWQLFDKCRNLHPPTHGELCVSTEHMCDRAIGGGRRRGGHPGREKELYFAKDSMVWVCTRRPHLFYYLRICRGGWVVGGTAASSGHYTNKCQYLFMPEISQTH